LNTLFFERIFTEASTIVLLKRRRVVFKSRHMLSRVFSINGFVFVVRGRNISMTATIDNNQIFQLSMTVENIKNHLQLHTLRHAYVEFNQI
jgi:hypothetical protein